MIYPPQSLIDQLADLEPRERLVALYAIQCVWSRLMVDHLWRRRIDQACLDLSPSPDEHADILVAAGRVARALKAELGMGKRNP